MSPKNTKPFSKKALITSMLSTLQQASSGELASTSISPRSDRAASLFVSVDASVAVPASNKDTDTTAIGLVVREEVRTGTIMTATKSVRYDFMKRSDSLLTAIQMLQLDMKLVTACVTKAEERG